MKAEPLTLNVESQNLYAALFRWVLCLTVLLHLVTGCRTAGTKKPAPADQIERPTLRETQLEGEIKQLKAANEELKKQIEVLSGVNPEERGKSIYDLQKVNISRYTDFYDKDKDGKKEKLIVYVQPIDEEGDIVKVAGTVDIQLWDLNKADGEAQLAQWRVEPAELKKLWFAALMSTYYRLTFDIADIVQDFKEPLTVKLTFTDYLTGKVYQAQKAIEPK